jgi:hypothetical protein
MAAVVSAFFTVFIKTDGDDTGGSNDLQGLPMAVTGYGPAALAAVRWNSAPARLPNWRRTRHRDGQPEPAQREL